MTGAWQSVGAQYWVVTEWLESHWGRTLSPEGGGGACKHRLCVWCMRFCLLGCVLWFCDPLEQMDQARFAFAYANELYKCSAAASPFTQVAVMAAEGTLMSSLFGLVGLEGVVVYDGPAFAVCVAFAAPLFGDPGTFMHVAEKDAFPREAYDDLVAKVTTLAGGCNSICVPESEFWGCCENIRPVAIDLTWISATGCLALFGPIPYIFVTHWMPFSTAVECTEPWNTPHFPQPLNTGSYPMAIAYLAPPTTVDDTACPANSECMEYPIAIKWTAVPNPIEHRACLTIMEYAAQPTRIDHDAYPESIEFVACPTTIGYTACLKLNAHSHSVDSIPHNH